MSFIGNIIWLVFGGLVSGLGYILGGLLISLTIIGIPFGRQAIKLGVATMTPFGREIMVTEDFDRPLSLLFNIVWMIVLGWEIAVSHLIHGLVLALTIVGIPFARQHFKLIPLVLFPFGRELR